MLVKSVVPRIIHLIHALCERQAFETENGNMALERRAREMGGRTPFLHIHVPSYSNSDHLPSRLQKSTTNRRDCLKSDCLQRCLSLDGGQSFLATALTSQTTLIFKVCVCFRSSRSRFKFVNRYWFQTFSLHRTME